jgi:hypothetical protein
MERTLQNTFTNMEMFHMHRHRDRQMCKIICKLYSHVMCLTAYTNIRPVQFLLLGMLFAQDHPPLVYLDHPAPLHRWSDFHDAIPHCTNQVRLPVNPCSSVKPPCIIKHWHPLALHKIKCFIRTALTESTTNFFVQPHFLQLSKFY